MRSLPVLLAAVALLASTAAASAQAVMFRVDYVKTRTVGSTMVEREEGSHTFAATGHRRVDRAVHGQRSSEVIVPVIARDGVRFVLDHGRRTVRRAPLDVETTRRASRDGESAQLRYLGQEVRGPLTLHHTRAEMPSGGVLDLWDYRFPNPTAAVSHGVTLAERWRTVARDGRTVVEETRIVNVAEVEFDPRAFDSIPRGYRVEELWSPR